MHPQFDVLFIRIREIISHMMKVEEFNQYNLDWVDIELKCLAEARSHLKKDQLMTKGYLLDVIEEIITEEIDKSMKEDINDTLWELVDEGKVSLMVNEEGNLTYKLNDNE